MSVSPLPVSAPPSTAAETMVAMRDGVRLATDIYVPSGSGPFPAVLMRTPYDKGSRFAMCEPMAAAAIDRGYALVAQDTRGKARSEGSPMPFESEALDGYDTLEWLSSQRWCNGRLAMAGASYGGFTQWAAVASGHPNLGAIAPASSTSFAGSDWIWRQGLFELGFAATWSAATYTENRMYPEDLEYDWDLRPLCDVVPAALGGKRTSVLESLYRRGEHDAYWSDVVFGGKIPSAGTSVAALHFGGWWDIFQRGQIADWARASRASPSAQPLVMGAFDHYLGEWTAEPAGIPDFSALSDADLEGFASQMMSPSLDFFDAVVRGRKQLENPRVSWELTHGDWQVSEQWPPVGARPLALYLTSDRDAHTASGSHLAPQPEQVASWTRWTHDPADLVPTQGHENGLSELMDPPDDALLEAREDVLVYSTEPLTAPLDLAGPILAQLQVGSSAPQMQVFVRLIEVFPDGTTRRIRDGGCLVRDAQSDQQITVDLGHTGYRVLPGHQLRVHITSSDFPRYLPYFGDSRDPWTAVDGPTNEQRIRVGGQSGARVVLTTLSSPESAS